MEQDLASLRKSNADQSGMLRNMQDVLNFRAKQADIGEASRMLPCDQTLHLPVLMLMWAEEINRKIHSINEEKAQV